MENEFNLRLYIEVMLRRWYLIVGPALLAAIVAFVFSQLQPPTYEASAVVVLANPRYNLQLDPRFTTEESLPDLQALPTLATSDEILQLVVDSYTPSPEARIEAWNVDTLSRMIDVSAKGGYRSQLGVILLTVTAHSPTDAAAIANTWADAIIQKTNAVYGQSEDDVAFLEEQTTQAEKAVTEADAAVVDFAARNQAAILQAELDSRKRTQSDYLNAQSTIAYLTQDIRGLREQLAAQPPDEPVSLADSLTALFLQIKAYNVQNQVPIQLQVDDSGSLSDLNTEEQIAFLDNLASSLEEKSAEIDTRLAELKPQILALQKQIEEIEAESLRLDRARDLASETHLVLTRKLAEARVAAQEGNSILHVISYAQPPSKPSGPHTLQNTVLAGLVGGMLGVGVIFFLEYWKQTAPVAVAVEE